MKSYLSRQERSVLAQFRSRVLPLHIETAWWQSKPMEERLCVVCSIGSLKTNTIFYVSVRVILILCGIPFSSISRSHQDFQYLSLREKFVYIVVFRSHSLMCLGDFL